MKKIVTIIAASLMVAGFHVCATAGVYVYSIGFGSNEPLPPQQPLPDFPFEELFIGNISSAQYAMIDTPGQPYGSGEKKSALIINAESREADSSGITPSLRLAFTEEHIPLATAIASSMGHQIAVAFDKKPSEPYRYPSIAHVVLFNKFEDTKNLIK